MRYIFFALTLSILAACGGGSGGGPAEEVVMEPAVERTVEFFGSGGNLWKPRSDEISAGGGRLVVLFDRKFTEQFDNCEIMMNTGEVSQLLCLNTVEWTQTPFSCFSNPDRQTWRASFDCEDAGEVRVICRLPGKEFEFLAPNERTGEVCSRFG